MLLVLVILLMDRTNWASLTYEVSETRLSRSTLVYELACQDIRLIPYPTITNDVMKHYVVGRYVLYW